MQDKLTNKTSEGRQIGKKLQSSGHNRSSDVRIPAVHMWQISQTLRTLYERGEDACMEFMLHKKGRKMQFRVPNRSSEGEKNKKIQFRVPSRSSEGEQK